MFLRAGIGGGGSEGAGMDGGNKEGGGPSGGGGDGDPEWSEDGEGDRGVLGTLSRGVWDWNWGLWVLWDCGLFN